MRVKRDFAELSKGEYTSGGAEIIQHFEESSSKENIDINKPFQ